MKERPIIFNTEQVRSILAGEMTQTRRVIKSNPAEIRWTGKGWGAIGHDNTLHYEIKCPFGKVGDLLWVREPAYISPPNWCRRSDATHFDYDDLPRMVDYAASMDADAIRAAEEYNIKKSRAIHMPKWANRINLKIINVRVQELQDISEDDAHAEGIPRRDGPYILDFAKLWDRRNAKKGHSWNSNPRVWVIEFSKTEIGNQ